MKKLSKIITAAALAVTSATAVSVPADAGVLLRGKRVEHVLGEVLADVVTAHGAPPVTRGA